MTSTFHSIETSRRSLSTTTVSLNTVAHNIANADTVGYSRQVVHTSATNPLEAVAFKNATSAGQIGTGVEATSVQRVRSLFLDTQYRGENSSLSSWTTKTDTLSKLETVINEPSDTGMQTVLNNFWSAWSDLSNNPQSTTNQKILKEKTLSLTDSMNQMSKQLDTLSTDLTSSINLDTTTVNSLLSTVGSLNQSIMSIESLGNDANDLRDQRDYAVDQLSKYGNVTTTELSDGYQINFGGQVGVTGSTVTPVTAASLQTAYQGGTLTSGEMHGLFTSRDQYVVDQKSKLDQLANTLANGELTVNLPAGSVIPNGTILNGVTYSDEAGNRTLKSSLSVTVNGINGLQKLGYNSAGDQGTDFFTASDSGGTITAGNITLNSSLQKDPSLIAFSLRTTGTGDNEKVVAGNGGLALIMSELQNTKMNFGTSTATTVQDYFNSMVGELGVDSAEAKRQTQNAQTLTDQVDSNRQSVSGVSLDEEMSDLLKFQHAYSASSRFMTTMDQLLDRLINSTGRVGL
ncbi:flagellar hook-associated protein FlgK [Paenibacillus sp. PsM32]|uniref:flagellar hook-associated protein FlgK n=1 Tax=Paenibacillus sp. PsM32 TaxID=3030536 RepID=UPI00263B0E25|nr:flagellar hook-associated protein FlgK [Paenibacillus sp. PsM32]MDN4620370.1 flagellar hook-associated protein FlgK [Paenibacillus sp. PsM32]